jgi:hypothetical protein
METPSQSGTNSINLNFTSDNYQNLDVVNYVDSCYDLDDSELDGTCIPHANRWEAYQNFEYVIMPLDSSLSGFVCCVALGSA